MPDQSKSRPWATLLTVKVVCCGSLLLVLTGLVSLNGLIAWFGGGGLIWLAAGLVLTALGLWMWGGRKKSGKAPASSKRGLFGGRP